MSVVLIEEMSAFDQLQERLPEVLIVLENDAPLSQMLLDMINANVTHES